MTQPNFYQAPSAPVRDEPVSASIGPAGLPLASRGHRLAAALIDAFISAVPTCGLIFGMTAAGNNPGALHALIVLGGIFLLVLAGTNLYLLYKYGQTIGKRLMDIKIVRADRRARASFWRILLARSLPA